MASRTLYPPIVPSSLPAFMASLNVIKIPITLSKFNDRSDIDSAHVTIVKKDTNMSMVKTEDDRDTDRLISTNEYILRARKTGIILNVPIEYDDNRNMYYIKILQQDLINLNNNNSSGWTPGCFYKIQIRFSSKYYDHTESLDQQEWLNLNSNDFSEWSTPCIIKAIGKINIKLNDYKYSAGTSESSNIQKQERTGYNLWCVGTYECVEDELELLSSYRIKLFEKNSESEYILREDTKDIYNSLENNNINYIFKSAPPINNARTEYKIKFEYKTVNGFTDVFSFDYSLISYTSEIKGLRVLTLESEFSEDDTIAKENKDELRKLTTIEYEEDEGCVGIRLYSLEEVPYSNNVIIRRASSKDNFNYWEDIRIITLKHEYVRNIVFYDYSIESGVWYKYGVQTINSKNERSTLAQQETPIIRNFEYSYLLGEGDQQLKLMFNNEMGSFKRQISESHTDTIGGRYSVFSRNSVTDYKTFPVSGLISFWMDEQNTFLHSGKKEIYKKAKTYYDDYYNSLSNIQYDYIYEREFRNKVSDFLYDGKPKLFKSPTEGNIIVRLTDVSMTPNQGVNRLIYSFTSTGYEIAENTIDNLKKYNLINVGEVNENFDIYDYKLGQISGEFGRNDNIFKLIGEKYIRTDSIGENYTVKGITNIKITFESKPMLIDNQIIGYHFKLNDENIYLTNNINTYELSNKFIYRASEESELYLIPYEGKKISAIIDFLYEEEISPMPKQELSSQVIWNQVGQVYGVYKKETNFSNLIRQKHSIDWVDQYRRINHLYAIEIEADPYSVFEIRDHGDEEGAERHIINATGTLVLNDEVNTQELVEIIYKGKINKEGELISNAKSEIILTYYCVLEHGIYAKKETKGEVQ